MITIKKQYYGIKFPFTANNLNGFFLDLNLDLKDKVASEIAHVLLTPKRSRIRKPDFGTDIIRYIFSDNTNMSWNSIEKEAKENVSKYVPNADLKSIEVVKSTNDDNAVFLHLIYDVKKGNAVETNEMAIKL